MKKQIILWIGALLLSFGVMQSQVHAEESVALTGVLQIRDDQVFVGDQQVLFGRSVKELQNTTADFDYNKNKITESIWDEMKGMTGRSIGVVGIQTNSGLELVMISGEEYDNPTFKKK